MRAMVEEELESSSSVENPGTSTVCRLGVLLFRCWKVTRSHYEFAEISRWLEHLKLDASQARTRGSSESKMSQHSCEDNVSLNSNALSSSEDYFQLYRTAGYSGASNVAKLGKISAQTHSWGYRRITHSFYLFFRWMESIFVNSMT